MTTEVCRVPMCSAAARTKGASAPVRQASAGRSALPGKSTEKLLTLPCPERSRAWAASAVMALESTPPDSRVHSGTSLISWRSTASASSSRTVRRVVAASSVCGRETGSQ